MGSDSVAGEIEMFGITVNKGCHDCDDPTAPVKRLVLLFVFVMVAGVLWTLSVLLGALLFPYLYHFYHLGHAQHSNAIVVLAKDPERDAYAEMLVKQGVAPEALSTLTDPDCLRRDHSTNVCTTGVRNTIDEALVMRQILKRKNVQRVTIVTSRSHVARAAAVFTVVFLGSGVSLNVVAPPDSSFQEVLSMREFKSLFPSLCGAILGRFTPELYEWILQYRYRHVSSAIRPSERES
jgi:uncharacterized SAM-binding protein YcdF (DUF218 family)